MPQSDHPTGGWRARRQLRLAAGSELLNVKHNFDQRRVPTDRLLTW